MLVKVVNDVYTLPKNIYVKLPILTLWKGNTPLTANIDDVYCIILYNIG